MLAPGSYLGLLVSGTPGASPEKKSPLIDVTFKIVSRAGASGWEDVTPPMDRRVSIYLSDAAWTYSERKLEQLGFNGSFRQPDFSDESKTTGVILNCSHEDYKGKPVIAINAATLWHALRAQGFADTLDGATRLLREF